MNKRTGFSLILSFAIIVGGLLLWQNRYNLYDWARLRSYTPSEPIAALAKDSSFNDYGTRLFYVNDPKLSDRAEFASQCKVREQTIVLGCYTGVGIFVFDVQDTRLNGVEEVTAAHEMLHAAYDRLTPNERKKIDTLTAAAYERVKDQELEKRMDGYRKTEPGEIPNELHSILGTEKRNLGSELEEYYKKYFTNRLAVVSLAENYEQVFVDIKNQVQRYDADLSLRKAQINQREQALEQQSNLLQSQRRQLDSYAATKDYKQYNALVPVYNTGVNSFNSDLGTVKGLISEYNQIVEQRNKLASDQETLAQSLDSRLETITQ